MSEQNNNGQMSVAESMLMGFIIVSVATAAFLLARWIFTTRAGAVFGVVAALGIGVYLVVADPYSPAQASTANLAATPARVDRAAPRHAEDHMVFPRSVDAFSPPPGASGGCTTTGNMTVCEWSRRIH